MGSAATRGMGPRIIGEEEYREAHSAPVIAKNLGFGARMLTDSPDAAPAAGTAGNPDTVGLLTVVDGNPAVPPTGVVVDHESMTAALSAFNAAEGRGRIVINDGVAAFQPEAEYGQREGDRPMHTAPTASDVTQPPGPAPKGYSLKEVAQLAREAPARARELFDAELQRPDGQRIGAFLAILSAANAEGDELLAAQAQGRIDALRTARTEE